MGREIDRNRKLADYIYKDLKVKEVVEMENAISSDPQWSDSYRLNVEVKDYLQSKLQLEEMREDPELEDAERLADLAFDTLAHKSPVKEIKPRASKRNPSRRMFYATALAASVAIIIAIGILPPKLNEGGLFDRYYEPYAASNNYQRGEDNELYRDIGVGIDHYREGSYQQSIDQFRKLGANPAIQWEVQLYSGLSHIGLGQYQAAQTHFESILTGEYRYQAETLWYLSLCYLKTGEFEQALSHLQQLGAYDGLYKKDAQVLRRKIRRLTP